MRKLLITAAAIAALAVPVTAGTASAAPVPAACGLNYTLYSAYYNHCGSTTVAIWVTTRGEDWGACVRPGQTYLGPENWVQNAWYTGGAGCVPTDL